MNMESDFAKQTIMLLIGAVIGFVASWLQWRLNLREDRKKLRREKLEALVGKIHEANRLFEEFLRDGGHYENKTPLDSVMNDIYTLVRLYFPEFRGLEGRVGKAYGFMLGNSLDADRRDWEDRVNQLKGELRGFEQDVVNLYQGDIRLNAMELPKIQ